MSIDFPSSPFVGQLYTYASTTWEYTGEYWGVYSGSSVPGVSYYISLTKSQIDTLILNSQLVVGFTYNILDADVPLYGGTSIFVQAISPNQISLDGSGIFYTPKYDQNIDGFGIWTKYFNISFTNFSIGDSFNINDTLTADNGAVATVRTLGANCLLEWVSGDWTTSINVSNGSETADISSLITQPPSYSATSKVIWGGYVWENLNGNVGSSIDEYSLDAEWSAITYNTTDYNVSVDVIHYDYDNDRIIYRKDKNDNEVSTSNENIQGFLNSYGSNPIKALQWGNSYNIALNRGVGLNHVIDSLFECINFRGSTIANNKLENLSYFRNNVFEYSSHFNYNTLIYGSFFSNIFNNNSYISYSFITYNCGINSNNVNYNSYFYNSILNNGSNIGVNILYSSYFETNSLNNESYISSNILKNNGYVYSNDLDKNSFILSNSFINTTNIEKNSLTNGSNFQNNIFDNVFLQNNVLTDSTFDFSSSGGLTGVTISKIDSKNSNVTFDISLATEIYGLYSKTIFTNSGGIVRLGYYDNTDTFLIGNVND